MTSRPAEDRTAPEVTVLIPMALRQYADGERAVKLRGTTVEEVLSALVARHQGLRRHLYNDKGELRNFVNIFLGEEDIRALQKGKTPLRGGESVSIVPAIAGGSAAGSPQRPSRVGGPRPQVGPGGFSFEQIKRYSRHLILPEVGLTGQAKLRDSSALILGAGGLGAPLGLYLAAAGVGRLGVVDFDVVEFSNLQRQVIHSTQDVGRPKLESAKERIEGLNPDVTVEPYETRLTSDNALEILGKYDVIVDGTDNFPTRYLVNDACVLLGKPNVYGSIFRFEGQASVFDASRGPCYRCLYPEPPPPGLVPSCAEGGVLGVLPGIVGAIQANEALKILLGVGEPLYGRLVLFDALTMKFRELKLRKDPDCVICGPHPQITELIDYLLFCGVGEDQESVPLEEQFVIAPEALKAKLEDNGNVVLVDVREQTEWDIGHIEGARLIPLGKLPSRVHELNTADEIVAYCHTGMRSAQAVKFLTELGFRKVRNLVGGIDAWSRKVDPSIPRY